MAVLGLERGRGSRGGAPIPPPRRAVWLTLAVLTATPAAAARLKDIASIEGVRSNQLSGYGLVAGLNGTGDSQQAIFTVQSVLNMLRRRGLTLNVNPRQLQIKNVAAVSITAALPPFARQGNRIDAQVSSLGDAKSLQGGTLLSAPLFGPDGQVYAVAQGPVSLGGGFATRAAGASAQKSHPTTALLVGGALVEREVPVALGSEGILTLALHQPDFTTAGRVATAVNEALGRSAARPVDAGTIAGDVRIMPVAIAHGSLNITVKTDFGVSQPAPFSQGQTVVIPDTTLKIEEGAKQNLVLLRPGVSLGDLVGGLNALGVTPQDLIAILQAIQTAGALQAELEIM